MFRRWCSGGHGRPFVEKAVSSTKSARRVAPLPPLSENSEAACSLLRRQGRQGSHYHRRVARGGRSERSSAAQHHWLAIVHGRPLSFVIAPSLFVGRYVQYLLYVCIVSMFRTRPARRAPRAKRLPSTRNARSRSEPQRPTLGGGGAPWRRPSVCPHRGRRRQRRSRRW